MKITLVALISILSANVFSQTVIAFGKTSSGAALTSLSQIIGGTSTVNEQYAAVIEGSAFFPDAFATGKIILSDGQIFDSISLRLDLLDNTVHYKNTAGEEKIAKAYIKTVILYDPVLQKENRFDYLNFIATSLETGWYQLLDTGVLDLYKRHHKSLRENKAYNSATIEQFINTTYDYYIVINSVFIQVKKLKLLPDILQNKKAELLEYIKSNNLTGKSDKDYLAVVAYYNSLVAKK